MKKTDPVKIYSESFDKIRPKLRCDSIFLPVNGGVFFRTSNLAFSIKGRGVYGLVSSLVAQMTGELTINEICSKMDAGSGNSVRRMLAILLEKNVVMNHVEEATGLDEKVLRAFSSQIDFIEHCVSRPIEQFSRFRKSRILLTGSGLPLHSLILSLARNGIETIQVDERASGFKNDSEIMSVVRQSESSGIPLIVEYISMDRVLSGGPDPPFAICYASDTSDLQELARISKRCREKRILFIPSVILWKKAFVGPWTSGEHAGCWLCFLLRHSSCSDRASESAIWREMATGIPRRDGGSPPSNPALTILGNMIGFELFRSIIGRSQVEIGYLMTELDIESLETRHVRLLPHPNCPDCSSRDRDVDIHSFSPRHFLTPAAPQTPERRLRLASRLIDRACGIAKHFDDDSLVQIPLFRTRLIMSRCANPHEDVIPGYSVQSNTIARLDAIRNAVRSYVFPVARARQMLNATAAEAVRNGLIAVGDRALSGWVGETSIKQNASVTWVDVLSLKHGVACRRHVVPAAAIYTWPRDRSRCFEIFDACVGVGFSFEEACLDALMSDFAHEILKLVAKREVELIELSMKSVSLYGADLAYLVKALDHLGQSVRLMGFVHSGIGSVVIAFSSQKPMDLSLMTVGSAATLDQAAAKAMGEHLALLLGGQSMHTLEHYLPHSLGYQFAINSVQCSTPNSVPATRGANQPIISVLDAFAGRFADVFTADLTTEDIAACGLFAAKALFARASSSDNRAEGEHV